MIFDSYGKFVFYDGAMGTMLYKHGLKSGEKPDLMNISAPDAVESVHRSYIEAGSDIILTNTFGSNALNLKGTGYSPTEVITAAVTIARRACDGAIEATARISAMPPKVALDIGSTGHMLAPLGELESEEAYELFKEMAIAGERAGADFAAIETMSDIEELKAAMSAVKDNTNLPILATMTFEKSGRTFMGCTPESFVEVAERIGAEAIGLNCSLEPLQMLEIAKLLAKATNLPLIIKPNAGLPDGDNGEYMTGAEEFAAHMKPYAEIGAKIIGGCCGTTPEYILELRKAFM